MAWSRTVGEMSPGSIAAAALTNSRTFPGLSVPSPVTRCVNRLTDTSPSAGAAELAVIIDIREELYQALFEGSSRAADSLADRYRSSLARAELRKNDDSWIWADRDLSLASLSDRIARAAVDLLKSNSLERLHQCEDRACGWVFLDDSPRRNRRWCVSSDCGDRNRSRTYYARKSKTMPSRTATRR